MQILEMILDQLNVHSLLSCRLVSKFWNQRASSVMKQRPPWITVDSASDKFNALYTCVRKSQDFPFRGLHITWKNRRHGRKNANLSVQRYLEKFGKLHTHLRLEALFCKNAGTLLSCLSKMTFLEVEEFLKFQWLLPFCMPSLRTVSFKGVSFATQNVLKEIFLASPCLEKIEHVDSFCQDLIAAIWDTERVKLVSSMILRGYTLSPEKCHKLVANPPALTSLTINGSYSNSSRQLLAAMKSVLFASKDTLKTLSLEEVCVQLDEIPLFAQLEELSVTTGGSYWFSMLPTLSDTHFPKLRRIRLKMGDVPTKESYLEKYESEAFETPVKTVTLLELDGMLFPNDVKFLAKVFPQVCHIRLKYPRTCYGNYSEFDTATSVWLLREFKSLIKLDIRGFPLNSSKDALDGLKPAVPRRKIHTVTSVDQFLTGIPREEICAKLGSLPKIKTDSLNNKVSRPNGSLIDLTGN